MSQAVRIITGKEGTEERHENQKKKQARKHFKLCDSSYLSTCEVHSSPLAESP
jgi:hypothetical protein